MKTLHTKDDISTTELLKGSIAFWGMLNLKTIKGMTKSLVRTLCQDVPHDTLNSDQRILLTPHYPPKYIAILVPWFQLDGTSLLDLKKALNERGIPAIFPEGLPYGKRAVLFHDHPQLLVDEITTYTRKVQAQYPTSHILVMGHSFGGTQALHAVDQLQKERTFSISDPTIIPVTISGVLDTVWPSAKALHALYWDTPSRVFTGENDDFIARARDIQIQQKQGITFVDLKDGYLPEHVQSGARYKEIKNPKIISSHTISPGHYLQWSTPWFARHIVSEVLSEVVKIPGINPQ